MSTVDQEEPALDPAARPDLGSTMSSCAKMDTGVSVCLDHDDSSDMLGDLTGRLVEDSNEGMQTFTVGLEPNTSLADNSENCRHVSATCDAPASPSDEAIDLTGYVRKSKSPATKRKRRIGSSAHTSEEIRLNELDAAVSVSDIDSCSESSSVKDEVLTADDISADWSPSMYSVLASIPLEGHSTNKQRYGMSSRLLDNTNHGSSVTDTAANTKSDQVVCALLYHFVMICCFMHLSITSSAERIFEISNRIE